MIKGINPRSMWRPKLKELPAQCVSCPFREGNDAEFGAVVNKVREKNHIESKASLGEIRHARVAIKLDLHSSGDFICHGTAYDEEMNVRPQQHHRQCPGATEYFKNKTAP